MVSRVTGCDSRLLLGAGLLRGQRAERLPSRLTGKTVSQWSYACDITLKQGFGQLGVTNGQAVTPQVKDSQKRLPGQCAFPPPIGAVLGLKASAPAPGPCACALVHAPAAQEKAALGGLQTLGSFRADRLGPPPPCEHSGCPLCTRRASGGTGWWPTTRPSQNLHKRFMLQGSAPLGTARQTRSADL